MKSKSSLHKGAFLLQIEDKRINYKDKQQIAQRSTNIYGLPLMREGDHEVVEGENVCKVTS